MNTKFALSMALGLAGASTLMASTVDVYITGSTAFRANVFTACTNLYAGGPSAIYFADSAHGGGGSGASANSWVMTGNPVSTITNLQGNTMVVHGLFTGSTQGLQTTEQQAKIIFAQPHGTVGGAADTYVTNSPTIGFSDASGAASPYTENPPYVEESVCVQPFVMTKSTSISSVMTNISNVSWEQLEYGIPNGRIPLAAWTGKMADSTNFIYVMERTKDSGTRRCETAQEYYEYNDPVTVYIYDYTNNFFYLPTVLNATTMGSYPNGVVGVNGNNNANLNWGFGYVSGGDIKNSLNNNSVSNLAIGYLSIADAKGVGAANWSNVVSFNGFWPTSGGAGIHNNSGTNDYSPIILGFYPCWGLEVLTYSTDVQSIPDQDITDVQLGTGTTPGTFMGVFNAQTLINGGAPIVGSIEREIDLTKPNGATAIPLVDMQNARAAVGGVISPPFN